MSIPKKRDKSASTAPEKNKGLKRFVAPKSTTRNPRVRAVIQFMEANLERKISLDELADAASLSGSYLCTLFKTETGLTQGEYLRRLRMEKARHLLAATLLSVKQIMAIAGCADTSNFVRDFKRYFDCTPSEYRQRNHNSPVNPGESES